ncbi:hypothetical protein CR513_43286, partial [Mucuna pruriens]
MGGALGSPVRKLLAVVVPLTILAVVVGQQSPDFGIWIERVTGCILEESIESRLCYGSCNLMKLP